ncbi:coiled-coil domain-containing protein 172 [Neoarius graeffei]|uniref:coiled-coil domain-containing protein 172 n=1 Tax=Neoarius graeffei TaxID=443677 RepID=UPI00298C97D2|nr:coiled-coil domain-containing protein 172 [Neoarius graeffei]
MSSNVQNISLDSLYEQILLTERQVSENNRQLQEVKSAIIKAEEKIRSFTEKLEDAQTELDEKARLESEVMLQLNLIKRQHHEIEKTKADLLERQTGLRQELGRINKEAAEEKEKFMHAIRTFNSEFNLLRNRDMAFQSQTRSEIQSLQTEAEALTEEMERMKQENPWLISLRTERDSLTAELQGLQSHLAGLEKELEEASALTESLKTERQIAVQKPQTDSTCLRLRKQLEEHKELEKLHEALSTEVQVLRSKLSQKAGVC